MYQTSWYGAGAAGAVAPPGPGPVKFAGAAAPPGAGPQNSAGAAAPPGPGPLKSAGARGPAGANPGPRKTLINTHTHQIGWSV